MGRRLSYIVIDRGLSDALASVEREEYNDRLRGGSVIKASRNERESSSLSFSGERRGNESTGGKATFAQDQKGNLGDQLAVRGRGPEHVANPIPCHILRSYHQVLVTYFSTMLTSIISSSEKSLAKRCNRSSLSKASQHTLESFALFPLSSQNAIN